MYAISHSPTALKTKTGNHERLNAWDNISQHIHIHNEGLETRQIQSIQMRQITAGEVAGSTRSANPNPNFYTSTRYMESKWVYSHGLAWRSREHTRRKLWSLSNLCWTPLTCLWSKLATLHILMSDTSWRTEFRVSYHSKTLSDCSHRVQIVMAREVQGGNELFVRGQRIGYKRFGNSPMSLKSIKTVLPFSSTPKLESSMSDWVNMSRSPLRLRRDTFCWARTESKPYARPR